LLSQLAGTALMFTATVAPVIVVALLINGIQAAFA
jgi:hypothetical protein